MAPPAHPLASWSQGVFGNMYTLPAASVIRALSDGEFSQQIVASLLGASSNVVGKALAHLRAGGLIKNGRKEGPTQWVNVVDVNHPFWLFVDAMMAPYTATDESPNR